jgi:hypothetical protein
MKSALMTSTLFLSLALGVAGEARAQIVSPPVQSDETLLSVRKAKGDIDGDGRSNILVLDIDSCTGHLGGVPGPSLTEHASSHRDWKMEGANALEGQSLPQGPWQVGATGDFNGDGRPDLFWQRLAHSPPHEGLEHADIEKVNVTLTSAEDPHTYPGPPVDDGFEPPEGEWTLVGSGDFGSVADDSEGLGLPDGKDDLLWRNDDTGDLRIWISDGQAFQSHEVPGPGPTIRAVAVAHLFADDVRPQIIFRDSAGLLTYWQMDGISPVVGVLNPEHTADPNWSIVGAGDFDGDGHDDLLWRNDDSRNLVIWFMDGPNRIAGSFVGPNPTLGAVDNACHKSGISGPR